MKKLFYLSVTCLLLSCSHYSPEIEAVLNLAGDNRPELEKVLAHYKKNPADSLKYKAACFLIENMPVHFYLKENAELFPVMDSLNRSEWSNEEVYARFDSIRKQTFVSPREVLRDIKTLSADFLIQHIDQSFANRESSPWKHKVSFGNFCEYILPYAVFNEKRELWTADYREKYGRYLAGYMQEKGSTGKIMEACELLNNSMITNMKMEYYDRNLKNYPPLMVDHIRSGVCEEYVRRAIYIMRSLGIPAGSDFTPAWGSFYSFHLWNTLVSDDGKHYPFLGFDRSVETWPAENAIPCPKIYRYTHSIQANSLAVLNRNEDIPDFLKHPNMIDVTSEYYPAGDVTLEVKKEKGMLSQVVYACTFNNQAWMPVAWGSIKGHRGRRVTFTDLGKNFVYLPAFYVKGNLVAANDPFLHDSSGRMIPIKPHPTQKETVTLKRKFHTIRTARYQNRMLNGRFQGANRADFSDAKDLHVIAQQPETFFNTVNLPEDAEYRYIRYVGGVGSFCDVAEIEFYSEKNHQFKKLSGIPIGTEASVEKGSKLSKNTAFDGDELTYFSTDQDSGAWVGLDLGKPEQINRIRYLPRNDDNNIRSGDLYELFYWDKNQWNSLGKQTGDDTHVLIYESCPSNALFLLHNHTRGKEERIFTYENGKQIWW
jgi:hypothetical protein